MKHKILFCMAAGVVVCAAGHAAHAEVAIVIEHQWTVGNNYFSAFAYDPTCNPTEFRTGGYSAGHDLRWSRVLDDTVQPWDMEGGVALTNLQYELFARDGFLANSASINIWGMNFSPIDETYFLTTIGILRGYETGSVRLDEERDLIKHFPGFPDSPTALPTNCSVSNIGLDYRLTDDNLTSSNGFIAAGVQPGHRLTLYPVDIYADIYSQTYTITEVVSDNVVRLDQDPSYIPEHTATGVGYVLSIQPHLTLGTFRQNIPYFAENTTKGPKAHNKGGMSPDGTTLYLGDIITDNLIAVDTQVPEQFTIFVTQQRLHDYVLDLVNSGRRHAIINADRAYVDARYSPYTLVSGWVNQSTNTIIDYKITDPPAAVGTRCLGATFNAAGAQMKFHADYDIEDPRRSTSDYTHLTFWIHGGTAGGQQMTVNLYAADTGSNGIPYTVPPPLAGEWTLVEIPIGDFGVSTIGDIVYDNTAGAAQPVFYLDDVGFPWTDPPPPGVGDFDTNGAGMASAQIDCDSNGRVLFSEGETDDILWTTNGVTFDPFLTSNEIVAAYAAAGAVDPMLYERPTNCVQVMGLIVDQMGTVYWSDNQTDSIWKAPAIHSADNIIELATKQEIKDALSLGTSSPRGLSCFSIRGSELLTFNFVDSNTVYKVDLETFDYGDFDGDFDVDLDDYAMFFTDCMAGPGVSTPPGTCTQEQFDMCDMDNDDDVDLGDYGKFQTFIAPSAPAPGCRCIYDLDNNCSIGGGDFGLFAGCWNSTETGPGEPCEYMDFDCNGTVAGGDFGLFAGVWLEDCNELDASTFAWCWACEGDIYCPWPEMKNLRSDGGGTAAGARPRKVQHLPQPAGDDVVKLSMRLTRQPGDEEDVNQLARASLGLIEAGEQIFAEVWARDDTAGSRGLAGVFVDLSYDASQFSVVDVEPGMTFTLFVGPSFAPSTGTIHRVGGATTEADRAVGHWTRVALVELEARAEVARPTVTIRPAADEPVFGTGRGRIPAGQMKVVHGGPRR